MAIELRSLRISSDFDSSSYVSGMNAKIAADNAGAQSSKTAGAAIEGLKIKVSSAVPLLERLSRTYVDGYGSAAKFNTVVQQLARSQDTNATSVAHLEAVYDGIQKKFGLVADASELAARGYTGLATAIENVNSRLSQSGVAESATAMASRVEALRQQFDPAYVSAQRLTSELNDLAEAERLGVQISGGYEQALNGVIEKHDAVAAAARKQSDEYARLAQAAREAQQADRAQSSINQTMGVGASTGLRASDSAAVFQEQLARQEEIARQRRQQEADNFSSSLQQSFNFGGSGASARDSASVFSAEISRLEQLQQQQAQQRGANFTADLNDRLGVNGFGTSAKQSASAFEEAARAAEELDRRVSAVRAQIDPLSTAQDRLNKALADYDDLARRGAISSEDLGKAQDVARQQFQHQREEIERQQKRGVSGLPGYQLTNLMYQGTDVVQSLALGMPATQVFLQQGPQIAQIFAADSAALKGLVSSVGVATIAVAASVAAIGVGAKAWGDYLASVKAVETAAQGLGQATAGTASQMEASAAAGANAANISIKSARSMEAAFLQTGKIGNENFEKLISISKDFGATFGTDADAAGKTLAEMFSDPEKAAQALYQQYGLIDAATARQATNLARSNRQSEAQAVLLDALPGKLAKASEATTALGRAWDGVATSVSNAWDWMGRATDRALSQPSLEDQRAMAQVRLSNIQGGGISGWLGSLFGGGKTAQANVDSLNEQIGKRDADASERQRQANDIRLSVAATNLSNASPANADALRIESLRNNIAAMNAGEDATNDLTLRQQITIAIDAQSRVMDALINKQARAIELDRLDIKIQNERNPVIRADLEARRTRLQLSDQEISSRDLENQAENARNKIILETISTAQTQTSDMRTEIGIRTNLTAQVAAGTLTADQANTQLQTELALRPLILAAATAEVGKRQELLETVTKLREAYNATAEAQRNANAASYVYDQQRNVERLRFQTSIAGRGTNDQSMLLAQYDAEAKIRELGAGTDLAAQIRANAVETEKWNQQLARTTDAWNTIRRSAEDAIDGAVDKLSSGDWKGALDEVLNDTKKTLLQLGISNPLKNALTGSNYGTFSDVGGLTGVVKQAFGGDKSVATMAVSAGTVVINGGVSAGGLVPGASSDAAGGVTRLLTGANSNVPNGNIDTFAKAIRNMESSGNYSALGPITKSGDRAYGAYGVMGSNIPDWTKGALGYSLTPTQFLSNKDAQDAVFSKYFGASVAKYGNPQDAASVWFTGRPQATGANASDILGTTGSGYVAKFNAQLASLGNSATAATQNLGTFGNGLGQLGQNLSQSIFPAAPSASAGGGGLFGWLGNLFSPSPSSILSTSAQARAAVASGRGGLFSVGGFTGYGAVNEPAGVVHRGEVVWSQRDVARAGGVGVVDAMRLGMRGYSEGGAAGVAPVQMPRIGSANSNTPAPVNVEIHNYSNASVRQEETTDARGNRQIKFVMADQVGDALGTKGGGAAKTLRNQYGVKQRGIPR